MLYNIGDHVALAEAGEESWGVVGQSVRLHNSFWGRRRVLGRTRRRVRRRVHVRGGQPLQAYLHRGVRGALLPRHARHCRSRPDRRVGQTTRQKSGAAAPPLTTSSISTHAGFSEVLPGPNSYRGDHSQLTPDGSTHIHIYDDGHETSMGTPAERMGLQVLPGVAYDEARLLNTIHSTG